MEFKLKSILGPVSKTNRALCTLSLTAVTSAFIICENDVIRFFCQNVIIIIMPFSIDIFLKTIKDIGIEYITYFM